MAETKEIDRIAAIDWTFHPDFEAFATVLTGLQAMATERRDLLARIEELEDHLAGVVPTVPTEAALILIINDASAAEAEQKEAIDTLYKIRHPRMKIGRCIRDQIGRIYKITRYDWDVFSGEFVILGERWDLRDKEYTGRESIIEWARPVADPEAG